MNKCIFLLIAFLSFSLSALAWNPYLMNHERFVHLNQQEKETVIIRTMELIVEMESQYNHVVEVKGPSSFEAKKVVQILKKLHQFLISEAVAAEFGDMGKQFSELLADKTLKGKLCIYGGWISEIWTATSSSGKKTPYCVHPSKATNSKVKASYNATKNSCGASEISCNPMVFGYKKSENKSPFCVATGPIYDEKNKSHNASYDCMKAALTVEGSADQDSKEVRLAAMSKAMQENPSEFNSVHKFIFRTCACGEGEMNQFYKDYIRPHRTCFGMMNSMRSLGYSECANIIKMPNADFVDKWNEMFHDGNVESLPTLVPSFASQDDVAYKKLINDENVTKYCKEGPPKIEKEKEKKWTCKTECKLDDQALAGTEPLYKCTVTEAKWEIAGGQPTTVELKAKEFTSITASTTFIDVELNDGTKKTCDVVIKQEEKPKKKECSIAISDYAEDKKKSVAVLSFQGYSKKEVPEEIKWSPEGVNDAKDLNTKTFDKTDSQQVVKVTYKIKGEGSKGPLSCEGKIPAKGADTGDKKYTINAVTADPSPADAPTTDVNATVTIDGVETKDLGALKISWTFKGDAAPRVTTKKKEEDDSKVVKDKIPEDDDQEIKTTEKNVQVPDGEVGTGLKMTATRGEKVYEACAALLDKSGKELSKDCDNIPLLNKAVPYVPKNNNQNFNNNGRRDNYFKPSKNTFFNSVL